MRNKKANLIGAVVFALLLGFGTYLYGAEERQHQRENYSLPSTDTSVGLECTTSLRNENTFPPLAGAIDFYSVLVVRNLNPNPNSISVTWVNALAPPNSVKIGYRQTSLLAAGGSFGQWKMFSNLFFPVPSNLVNAVGPVQVVSNGNGTNDLVGRDFGVWGGNAGTDPNAMNNKLIGASNMLFYELEANELYNGMVVK